MILYKTLMILSLGTSYIKRNKQTHSTRKPNKPWFYDECKLVRKKYIKLKRQYKHNKNNALKQELYETEKKTVQKDIRFEHTETQGKHATKR